MRVRHWPTRCAAAGGPVYQTTAAPQLRGLAYRPASSGGWQPGVVACQRSAGGRHSVRSDRHLQACGVLARRYCACAGVCCRRPCLVHPARLACPPSKGGFTRQGWPVCSDGCLQACGGVLARRYSARTGVCCRRPCLAPSKGAVYSPPGTLVAGLHLFPGLSWNRGMLLCARRTGLVLGSVPGHVLSHVCGHAWSVCPLLHMPIFTYIDRDAVYM